MTDRSRPVLVTGAFGNVGSYLTDELRRRSVSVVATDVQSAANERAAARWVAADPVRRTVAWADLRDPAAVRSMVAHHRPRAVVHGAAVIPPATYHDPELAWSVNVDGTRHLVEAVNALDELDKDQPCRIVFTSSMAVFGSRNPHTVEGDATAETPPNPREIYGLHKAESERILREGARDWVVLRLGAVLFPDHTLDTDLESAHLGALAPDDGRLHTVDGRDVATALASAVDADCSGTVLLVGGDESHRILQVDLATRLMRAIGLPGAMPKGLPGDPADDDGWFVVDWMDTTETQRLLEFQHHTFEQTLADIARHVGWKRRLLPLAVPAARLWLAVTPPRRRRRGPYADVWGAVAAKWGPGAVCEPRAQSEGSLT